MIHVDIRSLVVIFRQSPHTTNGVNLSTKLTDPTLILIPEHDRIFFLMRAVCLKGCEILRHLYGSLFDRWYIFPPIEFTTNIVTYPPIEIRSRKADPGKDN
jgi:hypothetical protein